MRWTSCCLLPSFPAPSQQPDSSSNFNKDQSSRSSQYSVSCENRNWKPMNLLQLQEPKSTDSKPLVPYTEQEKGGMGYWEALAVAFPSLDTFLSVCGGQCHTFTANNSSSPTSSPVGSSQHTGTNRACNLQPSQPS